MKYIYLAYELGFILRHIDIVFDFLQNEQGPDNK